MTSLFLALVIVTQVVPTRTTTTDSSRVATESTGTTDSTAKPEKITQPAKVDHKRIEPKPPRGDSNHRPEVQPVVPAAPPRIEAPGSVVIFVKNIALLAKPMPDGSFDLRPIVNPPKAPLEGTFGPGTTALDDNGRSTLKWDALADDIQREVIDAFPGSSTRVLKEQQQQDRTLEKLGKRLDTLTSNFWLLIITLGTLLALLIAGAVVLKLRSRRRSVADQTEVEKLLRKITGSDVTSVEKSLNKISDIVDASQGNYPEFAETLSDPWTIEDWRKEAARKKQNFEDATKLLSKIGERLPPEEFIEDAIKTLETVHAILFGRERQVGWQDVRVNLGELRGGKVGGDELPKTVLNQGLLSVAGKANQLDKDLREEKERADELEKRLRRLDGLVLACELDGDNDATAVEVAAGRVENALGVAKLIEEKGGTDLRQWVDAIVAERDGFKANIDEANRALEAHTLSIEEEKGKAHKAKARVAELWQQLRDLLSRLGLLPTAEAGDPEATLPLSAALAGPTWSDRLDLLALRDSWSRMIEGIPDPLARLLRFANVHRELEGALATLTKIEMGVTDEPIAPIYLIYDRLARILEFCTCYELVELEPLRPRLDVACADLRSRMKSLGIVCERPQLLSASPAIKTGHGEEGLGCQPEYLFDSFDEELERDKRIGARIKRELEKQRSFIVDVTQSFVQQNGRFVRPGHYHRVTPSRWR